MWTDSLQGKTALVTGASRGIGAAVAEALAAAGCRVVLVSRNGERCAELAKELQSQGATAVGLACDIRNGEECRAAVQQTLELYGNLHILVNNAGITRDNLLLRMKPAEWEEVLTTDLTGVFQMTQAALRPMLKQRYGKIINISSVVGQIGNPGQANYAAAKAGVLGFTKSLAREIASRGITVNAVAPGYIDTAMTAAMPEKAQEELKSRIPLGKIGNPRDVAGVVLFLASEAADYITGQTIRVDGGLVMHD